MYANRFLPSVAECEDLIQDIFISIWENKTTFPDAISLKIYLYKSTRNKCYNSIKHKKVEQDYALSALQSLEDDNLFLKLRRQGVTSYLPSFVPSEIVTIPTGQPFPNISNSSGNTNLVYYTSVINTQDNPILTIQTKYEEFYGNVTIQGSTIVDGDWYDILNDTDLANVSDTRGYTITGFHPYVKVEFSSNSGAVTNILAR